MCRAPPLLWADAGHSQTEQQKVNAKPRQEMPADDDLQDSLIATPQIQYPALLVGPGSETDLRRTPRFKRDIIF